MTTEEIIKDKLKFASLSEYEMSLWSSVLKNLPENMRQDILEVFNLKLDGVRILTDNLVLKTEALKNGNIEQWEKILKNDETIINSVK
jgi:hypothetical protein